jgi:hypothetical protein
LEKSLNVPVNQADDGDTQWDGLFGRCRLGVAVPGREECQCEDCEQECVTAHEVPPAVGIVEENIVERRTKKVMLAVVFLAAGFAAGTLSR